MRRSAYNPLLKSYPDSEKINRVSIKAETLYTRLIAVSDDAGRYWGDPVMVLARLFTHRMKAHQLDPFMVAHMIQELEAVGLLQRYKVKGTWFLELIDPHKAKRSDVRPSIVHPGPEEADPDGEDDDFVAAYEPPGPPHSPPTGDEPGSGEGDTGDRGGAGGSSGEGGPDGAWAPPAGDHDPVPAGDTPDAAAPGTPSGGLESRAEATGHVSVTERERHGTTSGAKLQATSYKLQATSFKLQASNQRAASKIEWTEEGGFEGITTDQRAKWCEAYPGVAIGRELLAMSAWLGANPKRRKKNVERFIVNWLKKGQRNDEAQKQAGHRGRGAAGGRDRGARAQGIAPRAIG